MKFLAIAAALMTALFSATPAMADWHVAESAHFVIYADQHERDVRRFADKLERFHNAMRIQLGVPDTPISPSNRVTVYVVRDDEDVQELYGTDSETLQGFYSARAGGSFAIVSRVDPRSEIPSSSENTLYHEYAHHMMFSRTSHAMPRWLGEGFAEFYSSVRIRRNGDVWVGLPNERRYDEINYAEDVSIEELLFRDAYDARTSKYYNDFYGRAWTLYHMLRFDPERAGQLEAYERAIAAGYGERRAAEFFGPLAKLQIDLESYLRQRKMNYIQIKGPDLEPGPITIRKLREGEEAIMPVRIRSHVGVTEEQAAELVEDARKIAARYPDDPAVQAALAEAEYDAGNDDAAIAAADRAIAVEPDSITALLQKGYAMERQAENNDDPDTYGATWGAVRDQYIMVNTLENDHPIPLMAFYRTYVKQGRRPPDAAVRGIEWALELAPFDPSLRWNVAQIQIAERRYADAAYTLSPLANSPHESGLSKAAKELLNDVIERGSQQAEDKGAS